MSDEDVLLTASKNCIEGMESIQRDAKTDSTKTFYQCDREQRRLKFLVQFPALARVLASSEISGNSIELFVCQVMPPTGDTSKYPTVSMPARAHDRKGRVAASYQSSMGRLAAGVPGDVIENFYIEEIDKLHPEIIDTDTDKIDSLNTSFQSEDGIVTITSLREYIEQAQSVLENHDSSWLFETESTSSLVQQGTIRLQKNKFGLSVVIGDRVQDGIFRASLDSRFVITGAPGTGKTTILINRLCNRLSILEKRTEWDREEDRLAFESAKARGMKENWIYFVPTELLKEYLKNALDSHGIGRLNAQLKTWDEYSYELAKNHFFFYLPPNKKGTGFIRSHNEPSWLKPSTTRNLIGLYEAFEEFRRSSLILQTKNDALLLSQSTDENIKDIGKKILQIVNNPNLSVTSLLSSLISYEKSLKEISSIRKTGSSEAIDQLALQCNTAIPNLGKIWGDFLAEEKKFSRPQAEDEDASSLEDEADEENQEDIEQKKLNSGQLFRKALRDYVNALFKKGKIEAGTSLSRQAAIFEKALPSKEELLVIGRINAEGQAARRLTRSYDRWLRNQVAQYRKFRNQDIRDEKPKWFSPKQYKKNHLCQDELDLLILSRLKSYHTLRDSLRIERRYREELDLFFSRECRMLVFVDEMTDFSPLQLACMFLLAFPPIRAFYACGDVNQRLTKEGVLSMEEIQWALPLPADDFVHLTLVYRQTQKLHELAQKLLPINPNASADVSQSNPDVLDAGLPAALCENCSSLESSVLWISERIKEIFDQCADEFPPIAVFVSTKEEVEPFAQALQQTESILNSSLIVEACPEGRNVSKDLNIGVYPISKIKGLEFESVFLDGVDILAEKHANMFGQYLYVAATRAIMYFGMTCRKSLPESIANLRDDFVDSWAGLR